MVAEWSDCSTNSSSAAEKLNGVLHNGSPRPSPSDQPGKEQTAGTQVKLSCDKFSEHQSSPDVCSSVTIAQSELDKKLCYISSQNHDFLLSSSLSKLAVVDGYQDVIVLCDGHSLAAHKLVLAAASHFLKAIFQGMAGDQPACVTIEGVKWSILCHIMQYIYIGQSYVQQEDVAEFIAAGQSLGICGLQDLHQYLLDHQKVPLEDSTKNNVEKLEENEELKAVKESDNVGDCSSNQLSVANVTEIGVSRAEGSKPTDEVVTNGFCGPAPQAVVMQHSSELIPGQIEVKIPHSHSTLLENEQIIPRSGQNPYVPVPNIHNLKSGSEDSIELNAHRPFLKESNVENKCKSMESSDRWTNSCESSHKRLKLSNPTQTHFSEQNLQYETNNLEHHNTILTGRSGAQNYASQISYPNLPLHFGKPALVNNALSAYENAHPSEKSSNLVANIENSSNFRLATWQNASRGGVSSRASSSSIFFNDLEIRPAENKFPRESTPFDASVPPTPNQQQDLSSLPPAHSSSHGYYGATLNEAWKEKFPTNAFSSNTQPYGVDGQAIGKLLSALAAQNMTGRLEQRETALPNDTISNNASVSKIESASGSSQHDSHKNDKPSFPLGGLPAQVLSKLSSDGPLSGDVISSKNKMLSSDSGCTAPDPSVLHKTTTSGAPATTSALSVHKFATQEEIDIVLDQYQRKLAFHEPRPCPCCDRMYRDAATLRTHLGIMHTPGTEPFVCSCGAQFKTKYEMHHHKKNGHYLIAPSFS